MKKNVIFAMASSCLLLAGPVLAQVLRKDDIVVSSFPSSGIAVYDSVTGDRRLSWDGAGVDVDVGPGEKIWIATLTGIETIDAVTGERDFPIPELTVANAVLLEAEGTVLVGSFEGLFRFDPATGITTMLVPGGDPFRVSDLALGPDGAIWASDDGIDGNGGLRRVDPVTYEVTTPTTLNDTAMWVTDSPDGFLYVSLLTTGVFRVDPITFETTQILAADGGIGMPILQGITALSDGRLVVVDDGGETLIVVDPSDPMPIATTLVSDPTNDFYGVGSVPGDALNTVDIPTLDWSGIVALLVLLAACGAVRLRRTTRVS